MKKEERIMRIIMSIILPVAMVFLSKEGAEAKQNMTKENTGEKMKIVIDAGHGGIDPGKIGVTGCYEKEINLRIAEKLKQFLETENIEVVFTRDGDYGLYDANDVNKKTADMKKRVEVIETANPVLAVSIHQNSYTKENVSGAQTFYYADSMEGKKLAGYIQNSLIHTLDKENHRSEKANDTYYLLKKTTYPMVIVECGFLSNENECRMLETDYYQEKVAWAIYMGIVQYLNAVI